MRNGLKQLPIGIDSFKELIARRGYFVDKTLFIREIMESLSKVMLFTRPRRFGKTLNFSMLKCFLEIPECRTFENEDHNYAYLFDGLQLSEERGFVNEHMGKYPVINFSFKKIKANGWKDTEYLLMEELSREYRRHSYVLESDVIRTCGQRGKFETIMNQGGRSIEYTSAITDLSDYLHRYFKKKAIVLIDEYDTPLHYAQLNGYYDEMLNIIRALMIDGLKGNDHLEKGIITGIMKIAQESIFSAFNNPKIATLTNGFCADMFGFTEDEVRNMFRYYGLEEYRETVREWYNGYIFGGDTVIYNPWSILSFFDNHDHIPQAFWANTGDVGLIKRCLQLDKLKGKEYIEKLYSGETIEMEIEQNVVYEEVLNNLDKALSYLLHAGYLKAGRIEGKGDMYNVSIPNRELAHIYKNILKNWFNVEQNTETLIHDILRYLLEGDLDRFETYLAALLLRVSSYHDGAAKRPAESIREVDEDQKYEDFYHGLILGIMVNISDEYYIESNREYGLGRPDIVIIPKDRNRKAYILEFKNEYTSSKKSVEDAAQEALTQIETKRYEEGVKNTGVKEIVRIGLGFKGKELKIRY
ncbi:MAG: AAA family ATPase [bacterium]|nr:AAA family ATPase [bacterium]